MHAENFLIDDGRYGQAIEAVGKRLPNLDVVPPLACKTTRDNQNHHFTNHPTYPTDNCATCIDQLAAIQSSEVRRAREPTFVVEAVDAVDGSTLVVAPQNEEILWVLDLESKLPARPKSQQNRISMCSDLVNTDFQHGMQCKMWTLVVAASE